jgi:hypothetical protein
LLLRRVGLLPAGVLTLLLVLALLLPPTLPLPPLPGCWYLQRGMVHSAPYLHAFIAFWAVPLGLVAEDVEVSWSSRPG